MRHVHSSNLLGTRVPAEASTVCVDKNSMRQMRQRKRLIREPWCSGPVHLGQMRMDLLPLARAVVPSSAV